MTSSWCATDECTAAPFIHHPVHLCQQHALMVSMNVTDRLYANAFAHQHTWTPRIDNVQTAPADVWDQPSHPPVVYFITNGNRVKIGVSTNISARTGALSLRRENAALLLQGGFDLEAALHQHFAADRIGRTEWFAYSGRIQGFITNHLQAAAALRQPVLPAPREDPLNQPDPTLVRAPKPSADEKILNYLKSLAPAGRPLYAHRDQIGALARLEGSTRDNALSRLVKAGRIHRQVKDGREVRGYYGLGSAPTTDSDPSD
jgi:hypothetical protein